MEARRSGISHIKPPTAVPFRNDLGCGSNVYVVAHEGRTSVEKQRQIGNVVLQLLNIRKQRWNGSEFIMGNSERLKRRNLQATAQGTGLRAHNVHRVPAYRQGRSRVRDIQREYGRVVVFHWRRQVSHQGTGLQTLSAAYKNNALQ